ncbi:ribonuclease inhibitor [Labedella phragmitis]|uniref:Ribonuclease inhibitor n=1 Tax=Labedella phragmitis TaxID=2498849 RepID=A0A3S5CBR3_9MICO|nr:barstar family protein [Labedella phragmitis]RWZ46167.1 ribonuclease inhibitor [Labedella phragmitis]
MTLTLRLDGRRITDIASFYDEVNRVFMTGESWTLGPSLDALDDLLYGGYGALLGADGVRVEWTDHDASLRALGRDATIAYHAAKLENPVYDAELAGTAIAELEAGRGRTYGEIVLDVFAGHPEIELILV